MGYQGQGRIPSDHGVEHITSDLSAKPAGLKSGYPPKAQYAHGYICTGADAWVLAEEPEAAAPAVPLAQLQVAAANDDFSHS